MVGLILIWLRIQLEVGEFQISLVVLKTGNSMEKGDKYTYYTVFPHVFTTFKLVLKEGLVVRKKQMIFKI